MTCENSIPARSDHAFRGIFASIATILIDQFALVLLGGAAVGKCLSEELVWIS